MENTKRKEKISCFVCGVILLIILLTLGITPITASAATDENDFAIVDIDGGVKITGFANENSASANVIIPTRIGGKLVKAIGAEAFKMETEINTVAFENDSELEEIGDYAFSFCSQLGIFNLPNSIQKIGQYALAGCHNEGIIHIGCYVDCELNEVGVGAFSGLNIISPTTMPENIRVLQERAFYNTSFYDEFNFILREVKEIGVRAFAMSNLNVINLSTLVEDVYEHAFSECDLLTIYTEFTSKPAGWSSDWNSSNRPVVWGCTFDSTNTYVVSVNNTTTSISNAAVGINHPRRDNYDFAGWFTSSDYSGTAYFDLTQAPIGILYAKWIQEESCVAEGTMVTLADGSQVAVENLIGNEELLVWNLNTGSFDSAPILFVDSDDQAYRQIIHLYFSDGTELKIVDEHALWCFDLNKYVYLDDNAIDYVGKYFNKKTATGYTSVQLIDVSIYREVVRTYSPVTSEHLCYYVNGLLSLPGGIGGMFNIYDVVATEMKYDQTAMQEDIATYGLFTYEEFCEELGEIPETAFVALGGEHLKVAMGKGLINREKILALIEQYQVFFI